MKMEFCEHLVSTIAAAPPPPATAASAKPAVGSCCKLYWSAKVSVERVVLVTLSLYTSCVLLVLCTLGINPSRM